ncbi:MAG TPA: four helix bundle protein [Terriglobales bacterium]|nr:four helix bundle protein [Terriglobales bacterium]
MQSFRNLRVWEKSHRLTLDVYTSSKAFPRDEMFGLTSQMRRASASIGMNIAEGCCRKGDAEMARFLQMAMGSASELEYQLLLAHDLEYLRHPGYERLTAQVVEVKKMPSSLMQKVKGVN